MDDFCLRPAVFADAYRLWRWRNDDETRRHSLSTDPVRWRAHISWLIAALSAEDRQLYVGEFEGQPVGQVRVDRRPDGWEVSITVAPEARGHGHAARLLSAIRQEVDGPLYAVIRRDNLSSLRAFRRAGYGGELEATMGEAAVVWLTHP